MKKDSGIGEARALIALTTADPMPQRPLWRWQRVPANWTCFACGAPAQGWMTEFGVGRFYCDQHEDGLTGAGYGLVRYTWRSTWHLLTWRWLHPLKAARNRRRLRARLRTLGDPGLI